LGKIDPNEYLNKLCDALGNKERDIEKDNGNNEEESKDNEIDWDNFYNKNVHHLMTMTQPCYFMYGPLGIELPQKNRDKKLPRLIKMKLLKKLQNQEK